MKTVILLLVFAVSSVQAQEKIPYDEFIKRVPDLSKQDREDYKSYPELRHLMWSIVKGMASRTLARLGYGTGPFLSDFGSKEMSALENFQRDLSLPVSGVLDSLTLAHIVEAEDFFFFKAVTLPTEQVWVDKKSGLARAKGTRKAANYKDAFPFNTQSIDFSRSTMTCEVSNTHIQWNRDELINSGRFMQTTHDVYTITRWDDEFIIAESEAICAKTVLSVNTKSRDVTFTTYTTRTDGDCRFMDKGPLFSTLVNGVDLWSDKRWDKYQNILNKNSDIMKVLQELGKLQEKYKNNGKK